MDAYTKFNQHIRRQAKMVVPDGFSLGEVVDSTGKIKVGGNVLTKDEYKILDSAVNITVDGTKTTFHALNLKNKAVTYTADSKTLKIESEALKTGDIMLCLKYDSDDGEFYIVLGKVVSGNVLE